jgi:hypothetical protein
LSLAIGSTRLWKDRLVSELEQRNESTFEGATGGVAF